MVRNIVAQQVESTVDSGHGVEEASACVRGCGCKATEVAIAVTVNY